MNLRIATVDSKVCELNKTLSDKIKFIEKDMTSQLGSNQATLLKIIQDSRNEMISALDREISIRELSTAESKAKILSLQNSIIDVASHLDSFKKCVVSNYATKADLAKVQQMYKDLDIF